MLRDPLLPIAKFRTFDELQARITSQERYHAALFSILAGLALLLFVLGLTSLASSIVHLLLRDRRRGEIVMLLVVLIIPVVAMSGAFDGGFLEVARAMGAAAVIQKPFTPDQVVKVVGRVLDEHGTSTAEP